MGSILVLVQVVVMVVCGALSIWMYGKYKRQERHRLPVANGMRG